MNWEKLHPTTAVAICVNVAVPFCVALSIFIFDEKETFFITPGESEKIYSDEQKKTLQITRWSVAGVLACAIILGTIFLEEKYIGLRQYYTNIVYLIGILMASAVLRFTYLIYNHVKEERRFAKRLKDIEVQQQTNNQEE
jgi:fatty acid desaturase